LAWFRQANDAIEAAMRLRLIHKTVLLLVGLVILVSVSLMLVLAYDLRAGFGSYLRARSAERLDGFARALAAEVRAEGGTGRLAADARTVPDLLLRLGPPPDDRPPHPDDAPDDAPEHPPEDPLGLGALPPPGPQAGMRLQVFSPQGRSWAGLPLPPGADQHSISAPVLVDGRLVAVVRMLAPPPVPTGIEAEFLHRQYRNASLLTLILAGFGGLAASVAARGAVRPLLALQQATRRIAQGDFAVRLPQTGHDELADTLRNVNAMAESLGRLETARREWLAQISHELRTPLGVLRGELEALADGVRPYSEAAVVSLQEETTRLTRLVDDLHLVALSDLAALPCDRRAMDAAAWLRGLGDRHRRRFAQAGLALSVEAGAPERTACWDEGRMTQLIDNVLENSLRYTEAPGQVVLSLAMEGDRAVLRVSDSAPGVPPEDLERLFEPLYRVEKSRNRALGGSGLGLSIVRAIATAHGGTVGARASALGGVTIEVCLPVAL
jgi:two-component system sensor histidine kinase BaeS